MDSEEPIKQTIVGSHVGGARVLIDRQAYTQQELENQFGYNEPHCSPRESVKQSYKLCADICDRKTAANCVFGKYSLH